MTVDWRGILLTLIPVALLTATLRLRDRYKSQVDPDAFDVDDLNERGPTRREVACLQAFTLIPLMAVLWALFCFVGDERSSERFSDPYSSPVGPKGWLAPALFAAYVAMFLVQDAYFRGMYHEAYRLPGEPGHSAQRMAALRGELILGTCLAIFLALQMHSFYVVFSPVEIRIGPVLAWRERVYSYDDVESIRVAPRFVNSFRFFRPEVHERTMMVIDFKDGDDWNSNWYPEDLSRAQTERLAAYVAERAGKAIERVEVLRIEGI
ncbi:MAG: hypothetical protein R3F21_00090 [Myxococcota bacterium]